MNISFDEILSEVVESFPDGAEVFVLQIGAGDGITGDFLHASLTLKRWRALLLEPHPRAFERLCTTYRDCPYVQCVQSAIAEHDGFNDLYAVRDTTGLPWWADQIPSLRADVIFSHETLIPDLKERVEVISIPCQTIATLMTSFSFEHADIAAIDAEGLDALIVSDMLKAGLLPQMILFEHKHLRHRERQSLISDLQVGYILVDGPWDTLCVRRSSHTAQILERCAICPDDSGTDQNGNVNVNVRDRVLARDSMDIQTPARGP